MASPAAVVAVVSAAVASVASQPPSLSIYPAASSRFLSKLFEVTVRPLVGAGVAGLSGTTAVTLRSRPVPLYSSSSGARCSQFPAAPYKDQCWCTSDRSQAWASFWFAGSAVDVVVTASRGFGNSARPRRSGG